MNSFALRRIISGWVALALLFSNLSVPVIAGPLPPTPPPSATAEPQQPSIPANFTPPAPGQASDAEKARAHEAITVATDKYAAYYGPRYSLAVADVMVDGEWAYGIANDAGRASALAEPIYILAHRTPDGEWQAALPENDGAYLQWLQAMPESLLPASKKEQLRALTVLMETQRLSGSRPLTLSETNIAGNTVYAPSSNPYQPRQLYLGNRAGNQLVLLLPEKTLTIQVGSQSVWLSNSIISARFLPNGRIVAIRDDMSLVILKDDQLPSIELLSPQNANGPLFVSPDGQRLAYLKPMDFEGGATPYTNGVAVFDLETEQETILFKVPYASVHLYGWQNDLLVVEMPYWDPTTMQPSPNIFLGVLSSYSPSTSITTLTQLPAIRPESNYPDTSPDQNWLVYDSREGSVVVDIANHRYTITNTESPEQIRVDVTQGKFAPVSWVTWHSFFAPELTTPLPQITAPQMTRWPEHPNAPSNGAAILLYRPASNSIPISAYKDLDAAKGQIRDWTGWTGAAWVYGHAYDQHEGTDYDGPNQSPWGAVYPAQTGSVGTVFIDCANTYPNGSYGTNFRITHGVLADGNSYSTGYGHLRCETVAVQDGQTISSLTQQIAEIGNTGNSSGAHLHLNVRKNDVLVDPYELGIIGDAYSGGGSACPAPSLNSPADGYVSTGQAMSFNWSALSGCTFNGYTFRIKNTSNMDSGGSLVTDSNNQVIDTGVGGTTKDVTINSSWNNIDLYWGVRAANAPSGASWAVRRFRIQPAAPCNPSADQIALFLDGGYGGQCVVKGIGDYMNPAAIGLPNDSISSIKVGGNVKASLCRDDNYAGSCEDFTGDDSDLGNNSIGNDSVSSVKVQSRVASCSITADQIALFVDPNYGGQCVVKGLGDYANPAAISLPNDSISSIKVGGNVKATLYRDDNYLGGSEDFTGDDSDLGNNNIGNDSVSSAKVQSRVSLPAAPTTASPANGAQFVEGTAINLSWTATGNEYYGEIWGGPGGTLTFGWQSGTQNNIGAQWAGYTYSWHVKARNGAGESGWSTTATFSVLPATPSNLSGQATSCSQVSLYWTDNSGNEDGYRVYRDNSLRATLGAGTTSYPDSGLSGNTTYAYRVHAYRGGLESFTSGTVYVTTPPCAPSLPDLVPSQWGGWPYPIVPSSVTGTFALSPLYTGQTTYIDWGLTNTGAATTGGHTYGALYIDNTLIANPLWGTGGNVDAGVTWAYIDWGQTISAPGWHTLKFVADPDNLIAESNESNNSFERAFYWNAVAPFTDTFEAGIGAWEATGLWHRIDASSAYSQAVSGAASWWYGQEGTGNYDTGAANAGALTSPGIFIPASGYYFRFRYRYQTETQSATWDQRWVQISVDDGAFSNLYQLSDDLMNYWHYSPVINLAAYAGHRVRLRFYFDTIDNGFNAYRGWYIDDFQITTTAPPACGDAREPNNTAAQASAIGYNQTISANICANGDVDYYTFTGTSGDRLIMDIDASINASALDAYLTLYDVDGVAVLSQNDDDGYTVDSKLGYTLSRTGVYYLRVRAWNHPSVGSSNHFYTLRLYTDTIAPNSAAFTWPPNGGWLNPVTGYTSAASTDAESGVKRVEFLWHSNDWANGQWVWLGADTYAGNGWSLTFDTTNPITYTRGQGGALYLWAFDYAENWTGAGVWDLGIDDIAPTASITITPMYGGAPFRAFYVEWNGVDAQSGVSSFDVQVKDGAGAWTNWFTNTAGYGGRFVGTAGHTYTFRARAWDVVGNGGSYTTLNPSRTVNTCAVNADAFESDNTSGAARPLFPNSSPQAHNFHAEGDADWLALSAIGGITYTLTTANIGGHADTVVELYDANGTTLLAMNDDDPDNWPASRLVWRAPASGSYRVKIYHWEPTGAGCTTAYTVSLTAPTNTLRYVYLPLISKPQPTDLLISRVEVIQGTTMSSAYRVHIAGRPGILRVFPTVSSTAGVTSVPNVSARLSCYQGAALQTTVTAGPLTVLAAPSEGNLSQTFNFTLPAQCLAAGASYVVELDTTNALAESNEANNRYPPAGTQTFNWQTTRPVRVILVPIDYGGLSGTGHYLPDTTRTNYLCSDAPTVWPITSITCSWHAPLRVTFPVQDDGNGWGNLLDAVTALHNAEGNSDALYYGVINTRAAGQCSSGCVAGMGWIGWHTAVGFSGWSTVNNAGDDSAGPVFTHEGGHNFNRPHAPCGTSGEAAYPYAGGIIGQWGYNTASATLINPNTNYDYMSYCGPTWTSDYTYKKIFDYRANTTYAPETAPQVAFAVAGTLDEDGAVQLAPITALELPLTPASATGTHRAELLDAQGGILASLTFTPITIAIDAVGPDGQLNSGSGMLGFHLALPALPDTITIRIYEGEQLLVEQALAPTGGQ